MFRSAPLAVIVNGVPERGRVDAVDLPVAEHRAHDLVSGASPCFVGQLVDERHLEDVWSIVAGQRVVAAQEARSAVRDLVPSVIVGLVLRARQRVGTLEQEAVLERAIDRDLQRVIARLRDWTPQQDIAVAAESVEERLAFGAPTGHVRCVRVVVGEAAVLGRSDVGDVDGDVVWHPPLDRRVPRLDPTARDVGHGRAHEVRVRQRDAARRLVRGNDVGNALFERRGHAVRIDRA